MTIRQTKKIENNIYNVFFGNSIDIYALVRIDGKVVKFFDIVGLMYPEKVIGYSDFAKKSKAAAITDPYLELKFINFIYKKPVLKKSFMKSLLDRVASIHNLQ